jgi:hypothetical protein
MDFTDTENPAIDRDGPFNPDVLSAYLIDHSEANMLQYYKHISPSFEFEKTMPRVDWQLATFYDNIVALEKKHIFQYAFDNFDNHFMLYKENEDLDETGQLWMRYKNHPLPFPLFGAGAVSGSCTQSRYYQQLYTYGSRPAVSGDPNPGLDINTVGNNCYDFGIINNTLWILGKNAIGEDKVLIMHMNYESFPQPIGATQFTVVFNNPDVPVSLPGIGINNDWRNWVGMYDNPDNIVFVAKEEATDDSIKFNFHHYNKYTNSFNVSPMNIVNINGTYPVYKNNDPLFMENVFRLAVSEEVVSIAYESDNQYLYDYINGITTIDILKSTLSDAPGDYIIQSWNDIMDPF